MIVASKPADINFFHIAALKGAVSLECMGMKRHGRPATVVAREEFGLPKSMKKEAVLTFLKAKVEEMIAARHAEVSE